ncbi:hypothetical protein JB92DRAFT_2859374 [Gautieria morchelliformis]|nr:hypothetical protein JB92DRAFT_2859374 [Gautieria morchelliformis]
MLAPHRVGTLLPASFILSFLSVSLTPSFVSLTLLLTSLLLYTKEASLYQNRVSPKAIYLWATLTASIALSNFRPTINALSTPSTSIGSLIFLSGASSLLALVPIIARHSIPSTGPQMHLIVFPTLWTVTWLGVSSISPIGRLATWTPMSGVESYQWIRPFFGLSGLDWIVAAWATVAAELIANPDDINQMHAPLVDIGREEAPKTTQAGPKRLAPLTILFALTVPSFFSNSFPLPPLSPNTTPVGVACILPQSSEGSQVKRFIDETKKHTNSAKILLWPESAVVFETKEEKDDALEQVLNITAGPGGQHVWVGVSFEERVSGSSSERDGLHRNGLALVGPNGVEMTYYKRKLVPIAESFHQISSGAPPTIHTIELPRPKHISKEEWGEARWIPLSASICLDFSSPLTSLPSRPALILAPAKTWHVDVGRAMYELARARGDELGADVLWCDGGAGGLSGVAGDLQVGSGSWVKTIGIPYPAGERRTVYGICGDWLVLAAFMGVPGVIFMMGRNMNDAAVEWRRRGQDLLGRIRGAVRRAPAPPAQTESLLDAPVPSG